MLATGMAALHATFFTILNPGDHAIVSDVVYMRTHGLFSSLLPAKLGIEVDLVDITDLDAVRAAVRPNTRLIHTEVIANPDLKVANIAALAEIAHGNGALLTVDSTFTPPPLFHPLDHDADLVIHSLTKYVNGHGDAMGGAVIGSKDLIDEIKLGALHHAGGAIAPFNAWLIMRGSVTLPLRLQRHCENAVAVATFLAQDPRVSHVAYPGLPADPHHAVAAAQLSGGYGGVVSFAIAGSHEDRLRFVNDLRVITSAVSLGHDETLVAYEQYPPDRSAGFAPVFREHGLIRLAIGLEAPDDLIADLDAALTTTYGAAVTAIDSRTTQGALCVICCQFIFKPGTYDEDFHRLDGHIDDYARALPGFVRVEKWQAPEGDVLNAMYYFTDQKSVAQLARFPQHREAKGQVQRWYDGYRIVVSEVKATYGDDRLPV